MRSLTSRFPPPRSRIAGRGPSWPRLVALTVSLVTACTPAPVDMVHLTPAASTETTIVGVPFTPPGNGVPTTAWLEPLDENGYDLIEATRYSGPPGTPVWPVAPWICLGDSAVAAFDEADPSDMEEWVVELIDPWPSPTVADRFLGSLDSLGRLPQNAWENARSDYLSDRASANTAAVASLQTALASIADCDVFDSFEHTPVAILACSVESAQSVWNLSLVKCMDLDNTVEQGPTSCPPAPDWTAECSDDNYIWARSPACLLGIEDGLSIVEGHELRMLLPNPFTPDAAFRHYSEGHEDMLVAILENHLPRPNLRWHAGFERESLGMQTPRLWPFEGCRKIGTKRRCTSEPNRVDYYINPDEPRYHIAATATHVMGSMTDGLYDAPAYDDCDTNPDWPVSEEVGVTLDPPTSASSFTEREQDSGLARNIDGVMIAYNNRHSNFRAAVDRSIEHGARAIVNAMWHRGVDCDGHDTYARGVRTAIEAGVPYFIGAGNMDVTGGPGHGLACNVTSPGAAVGAFTSAALDGPSGLKHEVSSYADPAGRRSRIDMAVNGRVTRPYYEVTNETPSQRRFWQDTYEHTSLATSTMAGAALVYADHYENTPGGNTIMRLPEILYSHLLLMGDRLADDDGTPTTREFGYCSTYGAGRLRMSSVFSRGTAGYIPDGSYHTEQLSRRRQIRGGWVCLGDGEVVTVPIPDVTDRAVDLTVVAYLFDPRHADDGTLDEVELGLVRRLGSSTTLFLYDTSGQEKLRARRGLNAAEWSLYLRGRAVSHQDGCGAGRRRVFFAFDFDPVLTTPAPWEME